MKYVTTPRHAMGEALPGVVAQHDVTATVYADGYVRLANRSDKYFVFDFNGAIDQWTADHLAEWLDGLGEEEVGI